MSATINYFIWSFFSEARLSAACAQRLKTICVVVVAIIVAAAAAARLKIENAELYIVKFRRWQTDANSFVGAHFCTSYFSSMTLKNANLLLRLINWAWDGSVWLLCLFVCCTYAKRMRENHRKSKMLYILFGYFGWLSVNCLKITSMKCQTDLSDQMLAIIVPFSLLLHMSKRFA